MLDATVPKLLCHPHYCSLEQGSYGAVQVAVGEQAPTQHNGGTWSIVCRFGVRTATANKRPWNTNSAQQNVRKPMSWRLLLRCQALQGQRTQHTGDTNVSYYECVYIRLNSSIPGTLQQYIQQYVRVARACTRTYFLQIKHTHLASHPTTTTQM